MLLDANPFAEIPYADIEFWTGEAIYRFDFNNGFIALPSRLKWRMEGTAIRPASPIRAIPTDASPAVGMLATAIMSGYCDVGDDLRVLTVDDPRGLRPGTRIAILATHVDESVDFRLETPLPATASGMLRLAENMT